LNTSPIGDGATRQGRPSPRGCGFVDRLASTKRRQQVDGSRRWRIQPAKGNKVSANYDWTIRGLGSLQARRACGHLATPCYHFDHTNYKTATGWWTPGMSHIAHRIAITLVAEGISAYVAGRLE